jgi:spore coat protein A, manganese oxidase
MGITRRALLAGAGAVSAGVALRLNLDTPPAAAQPGSLPLPRYQDPLTWPAFVDGTTGGEIRLVMRSTTHLFSSKLPPTPTLAYELAAGSVLAAGPRPMPGYLGPTIVARTGVPTSVRALNRITRHPLGLAVDTALHGVRPEDAGQPRTVVHLHGGNTSPDDDGGPLDTWPPTPDHPGYPGRSDDVPYSYSNTQDAAGLWYHDHAIGITRLNVHAGLAGGYLVRDEPGGVDDGSGTLLPPPPYEIPLVLQDRAFTRRGELAFPPAPWSPESFGNVPVVNGTAWPFHEVTRGLHRFRVYGATNARAFDLTLEARGRVLPFWQIGADGGLFDTPVRLQRLLLTSGERADLVVDFRALPVGAVVTVRNQAVAPYPSGARQRGRGGAPLPELMQFRVTSAPPWQGPALTAATPLRPPGQEVFRLTDRLAAVTRVRTHSLIEVMDAAGGVLVGLLNNRHLVSEDYRSDPVRPGTLELWEIANTTADTHPIHLHLVQFQVLDRQPFDAVGYLTDHYDAVGGMLHPHQAGHTGPFPAPPVDGYLTGPARPAEPNEVGWKDTAASHPGEVLRLLVPFGQFSADARLAARRVFEGEYVWHCHILDHEDNDMMQRFLVDG